MSTYSQVHTKSTGNISLVINAQTCLWSSQVCWEDFAFFDPVMYETFRQLILDAKKETANHIFDTMGLSFHVVLSKEEGGREYDLIPNGALQPVTPDNILDYVSRYAYLRMVHIVEEPLQVNN